MSLGFLKLLSLIHTSFLKHVLTPRFRSSDTLAKVQNGIEIWLNQLDSIEVAEDGNTAVLGGGVYISPVINELAKYKKVTGKLIEYQKRTVK
jgi:hypothetical protein